MNEECRNLLKTLIWKNSRVRNGIPNKWLEYWLDEPKKYNVRDDIKGFLMKLIKLKNYFNLILIFIYFSTFLMHECKI